MDTVAVLLVSPIDEDVRKLESIFSHSNWKLFRVAHQDEAVRFLSQNPTPVVITDCGCGEPLSRTITKLAELCSPPPRVIVASRLADDPLWVQVLDCGGYNVLQKPFDPHEVYWVVSHAWRDWKAESALGSPSSRPAQAKMAAAAPTR